MLAPNEWRYDFVPEYEALHFQNTITMIRNTDLQETTTPGMNYTACYRLAFLVRNCSTFIVVAVEPDMGMNKPDMMLRVWTSNRNQNTGANLYKPMP